MRGGPVRRLQLDWDGDQRDSGQRERRPRQQRERVQGALLRQLNMHLGSKYKFLNLI